MSNQAAWLIVAHTAPFKVDSAPYPEPAADEVIVKNAAVAINPIDYKMQMYGTFLKQYPAIIGQDFAGEIVELGSNVTGFTVGQRVLAQSQAVATGQYKHAAFQLYVAVPVTAVAALPSFFSFEQGSVLPLAISTAAAGLYQPGFLELPLPSASVISVDQNKILLVWGAASSVGSAVVQLACASGITVFATVSPSNFDFVKSLGAAQVFDYHQADVVQMIVDALNGSKLVGVYDAISLPDTMQKSAEIVKVVAGKGFVATVLPPLESLPDGVIANRAFALSIFLQPYADIGKAIWGKFLPEALENGRLVPKPDPFVVGKGLEQIQDGLDRQKAGVSAQKVVVKLQD